MTAEPACHRHPDQPVTGFCADCLRERLAGLDQPQDTRRKSTSSLNPLRAIFRPSGSTSFLPELRRCKSFSAPRAEALSGVFEPQRKSCDVRARNIVASPFHEESRSGEESCGRVEGEAEFPAVAKHEIGEAEEVIEEEAEGEDSKTIKDHIDLDSVRKMERSEKEKKDLKEIAGSFWLAASGFSKKLQKWRRNQKIKKNRVKSETPGQRGKPALSEVADYGYGRRSCDTDPRFSLDIGRISFDGGRYSLDEPRASWDGYLIGARALRLPPAPMLSVQEDPPAPVPRSDSQIPVEEARNSVSEEAVTPGGTLQTREYYSGSASSSHRRKSFDRSGSVRSIAVADIDDTKSISNSKISPDYPNGTKLRTPSLDRESKAPAASNPNSLRDDCWESFDSVYRDPAGAHTKPKKSRRWSIWGLIHRRNRNEDERSCAASVLDRSFSESWPELRRDIHGEGCGALDRKVFRSNSSVSSRGSFGNGGPPFPGKGGSEKNGQSNKKREEVLLERNRSARYSPNHSDSGLLRFYLTPLRGSRRSNVNGVSGKNGSKGSYSFARTMLPF